MEFRGGVGRPAAIRLRQLGGGEIAMRPSTADAWAVATTLLPPNHLPPPELDRRAIRTVWDLGANIGVSMAHLAISCPRAHIVGLELEPENARLCRRNVAPWAERCTVIEAAAWTNDGEIAFTGEPAASVGYHVSADGEADGGAGAGAHSARALSLDTVLAAHTPGETVDYVKMDIEGAEAAVLTERTGWAERVRAMTVEVHEPYTVEACVADLERLGFRARRDPSFRGIDGGKPPVIAVRDLPG